MGGDESDLIESVTIVGGGDAGLMTALALDEGLDEPEIRVIDDFEQSVPEVGKSTLTFVAYFLHNLLGVDRPRMIRDVKLAFKTTVFFEDWCGVGPFHSPLGEVLPVVTRGEDESAPDTGFSIPELTPKNEAEFHEFYYRYLQNEFRTIYGAIAEEAGVTPLKYDSGRGSPLSFGLRYASYHFDSRSLNKFMRDLAEERGITLLNDRITDVRTGEERIDRLESETDQYTADLYVDASGFQRTLMTELGADFDAFDLPVDAAVVTTTDIDMSELTSATVVTSGDAGWFWQIDTPELRDLGYVYSSDHISDTAAIEEFVDTREEDLDPTDVRQYRFESGVLGTPWINNCVAIGNALGFVEPLQSTALSTTALLATRLSLLLGKHGRVNHPNLRQLFNDSTRQTWEEVYRFISLYYLYNQGETDFWADAREIDPGPIDQRDSYHASGMSAPKLQKRFTRLDLDLNNYYLYHLIMRELGVESRFYEGLDLEIDTDVVKQVHQYADGLEDTVDEFLTYEEFHSFHPGYD